jgi:hypothetical protein
MLWRRREPQTQAEVEPGRFFRVWRWTKRIAAALALVLVFALVAGPSITGHLLKRERDRLRQLGEPLTLAEVTPSLPAGAPNAADVYQRAFDTLDRTEEEEALTGLWSAEDLPPGWVESMRPVVQKNEQYFAVLEGAAQIEACVFPVEWEKGPDLKEPHLAHLRSAARMVNARALVLAADGRADEALQCFAFVPAMVQHLCSEPTLVSQLVRYALLGIGMRGAEQTLNRCDPSPEVCRDLYDAFGEADLDDSVATALRGERVLFGGWAFASTRAPSERPDAWTEFLFKSRANLDELLYLRAMQDQIDALELPWPEAQHRARAAADRATETAMPLIALKTAMILAVFAGVAESCRRIATERDVCRIGLALRAYQDEHGRYPDSMEDLAAAGWEVPRDSFTDEPYRYRREGDGFRVWGVGPDLDDDGGKPFKPSSSRRGSATDSAEDREARNDYDIVFRCSR